MLGACGFERSRKIGSGRKAICRKLLEAPLERFPDVRRRRWTFAGHRRRSVGDCFGHYGLGRGPGERRLTGQHLV